MFSAILQRRLNLPEPGLTSHTGRHGYTVHISLQTVVLKPSKSSFCKHFSWRFQLLRHGSVCKCQVITAVANAVMRAVAEQNNNFSYYCDVDQYRCLKLVKFWTSKASSSTQTQTVTILLTCGWEPSNWRLSTVLQRGNAISFYNTMVTE